MNFFKIIASLFLITSFYSCKKLKKLLPINSSISFLHDEKQREYILYLPENLPKNAPLVFVLHGYTQDHKSAYRNTGMNAIADTAKFAVCYPLGSLSNDSIRHWNSGLEVSKTNDVDFLEKLAKNLQEKHLLNPKKTFSCGFSNGGFMSYTLACEAPKTFQAIASVSGTMSKKTWDNCPNDTGISILQIHGTKDNIVPLDGSMTLKNGWGGAPKMDSIIKYWSHKNQSINIDSSSFNSNIKAYQHQGNKYNTWFYKIGNFKHQWPNKENSNLNASALIWRFFKEN